MLIRVTSNGDMSYLEDSTEAIKEAIKAPHQSVEEALYEHIPLPQRVFKRLGEVEVYGNEEGKLFNPPLPHNPYVQQLWDQAFGPNTDYMVGDFVFVSEDTNLKFFVNKLINFVNEYVQPHATVMVVE